MAVAEMLFNKSDAELLRGTAEPSMGKAILVKQEEVVKSADLPEFADDWSDTANWVREASQGSMSNG